MCLIVTIDVLKCNNFVLGTKLEELHLVVLQRDEFEVAGDVSIIEYAERPQVDNYDIVAPGQNEEVILNLHHLVRSALNDSVFHDLTHTLFLYFMDGWGNFTDPTPFELTALIHLVVFVLFRFDF